MGNNAKIAAIFVMILAIAHIKDAQEMRKPRKPRKKVVDAAPCPDTCTLKRRIGKVEQRFENDVMEVKAACLEEISDLRMDFAGRNISITAPSPAVDAALDDSILSQLEENITTAVDSKLDKVVIDLKGEYREGQERIKDTYIKVKALSESITSTLHDDTLRTIQQRAVDLRNTIDVMNRTLHTLQLQNIHLQRQTQAVRTQTAALRAQNDILVEDNRELRKQVQKQRPVVTEERLEEIEGGISRHVSSLKSLEQQFEWLTNRVNTLADGVDAAAFEAAGASETANRAAAAAKQAVSLARGRPATEDTGPEEQSDQLRQPETPPTDCWELYQMGYNISGVYRVKPWRSQQEFDVYCEQSYNGGGWTLIQRRRDGSVDFDRDWNDYAAGFGELTGEVWLGNDKIHSITSQDSYVLQVLLLDWDGNRAYAEYEGFRVQNNRDFYSLRFGRFTRGNAGDGFRGTSDDGSRNLYLARFTTTDMDNDSCRPCIDGRDPFENCADLHGGGWWFRACSDSNLNGRYIHSDDFDRCRDVCYGIQWSTWHDEARYSLKASIMLIRPLSQH